MSQLTPAQRSAVVTEGNVLVEAGAGTGKTRALVERCLARVLDGPEPMPLKDLVIVTFTEAAAAEMRKRIRSALEEKSRAQPDNRWIEEQLASVDTAWISTLHGFCLSLAREHFHELGLDPQFSVLAQEQANILVQEALDTVFTHPEHAPRLAAPHRWARERGQAGMEKLRGFVRRLYDYTQTLRHPAAWFERELAELARPEPEFWIRQWPEELDGWRASWREALEPLRAEGFADCLPLLAAPPADNSPGASRQWIEQLFEALPAKKGLSKSVLKRRENLAGEIDFLRTLMPEGDTSASLDWPALREDWEWTRHAMADLLQLTLAFQTEYTRRKAELGGVDFHDLEQNALKLLCHPQTQTPNPIAELWRQRAQMLLIDEYQDINEAQDAILECLARPGSQGNRFLVGDIKQSIYRFRLANPRIFQHYARLWRDPASLGHVLRLTENFRSHPAILGFVNRFFTGLMREQTGGVDYNEETALRPGDPASPRFQIASPAGAPPAPRVELWLVLEEAPADNDEAEEDAIAGLSRHELEARQIGLRLREMRQRQTPVWEEKENRFRPVEWRDMAILLRSPSGKAEVFAKEFARLGIPLSATRSGFYDAIETSDWLNMMRLLDNPLQDFPLLAVLRSPLAGFSAEELVRLRLADRAHPLWTALQVLARSREAGSAREKAVQFLERYGRWRPLSRTSSLSECLSLMLDETLYETWLSVQPRAAQRQANVRQLLNLTRQFDQFQRQGLFRFLRFVEAQIDAGAGLESPMAEIANTVRLLSIHQSKGLEFPVTVVSDLAKGFNESDLQNALILDERLGLCPVVKAPDRGQKYPSMAHWFARRRQRQELAGEEMRLLYVAMTRAREYLILTGSAKHGDLDKWAANAGVPPSTLEIAAAKNFLDWIGPKCAAMVPNGDLSAPGEVDGFAWHTSEPGPLRQVDASALPGAASAGGESTPDPAPISACELEALRGRLSWRYEYDEATQEPGKTSVSAWRRRMVEETDSETYPLFIDEPLVVPEAEAGHALKKKARLSAADVGTAHHRFMEWIQLDKTGGLADIEAEAERMVRTGILTAEEKEALDLPALAAFWTSELGRRVCEFPWQVRRELPFTARFTAGELRGWMAGCRLAPDPDGEEDFMVVQGVVDLAVVRDQEIWVIDYKTDHAGPGDIEDKVRAYAPQLALYATALSRVYRRPVTQCWLHFLALSHSVSVSPKNWLES